MSESVRIFISSTWLDLRPERKAVEEALHRMKSTGFSGMEYFGSHPDKPRDLSLAEVEQSEIYVGIFAHRYGSGITEAEYRQARELDIPCLIYFKDDSVPVVPAHIERDAAKLVKLEALKQELKDNHTVSFFTDPNQLSSHVVTDLHNILDTAPTKRAQQPQGSTYHIQISGGQGITIGDHNQVTQHFTDAQLPAGMPEASRLRLEHLADNIQQDLALLKEFEDALRYADDPRRKARYRKEIQQLRESAMAHQQELDALQAQFSNVAPSEAIQAVASQVHAFHEKLDALQSGQRGLSQQVDNLQDTILARYDVSEHTIITAVIERLDRQQLTMTEDVLDAIDAHKLSDSEMSDVLVILQQTLSENRLNEQTLPDTAAADEIRRAAEFIDEPELDIAHKLKIGVPIIPFILSYEGEVALKSGMNLETVWRRLVARVREE